MNVNVFVVGDTRYRLHLPGGNWVHNCLYKGTEFVTYHNHISTVVLVLFVFVCDETAQEYRFDKAGACKRVLPT